MNKEQIEKELIKELMNLPDGSWYEEDECNISTCFGSSFILLIRKRKRLEKMLEKIYE